MMVDWHNHGTFSLFLSPLSAQLGGLAVLGIGIWVKIDGNSFVKILGAAAPQLMQLINVGYLCIAVGCFLLLMGFMGCWGAVKESRCLLILVGDQKGERKAIYSSSRSELSFIQSLAHFWGLCRFLMQIPK